MARFSKRDIEVGQARPCLVKVVLHLVGKCIVEKVDYTGLSRSRCISGRNNAGGHRREVPRFVRDEHPEC